MEGSVGQHLVQLCKAKRLKYTELSNVSGVSRGAIYQIVHGKAEPRYETVAALAAALGVCVELLYFGEESRSFTAQDKQMLFCFHRLAVQEQEAVLQLLMLADKGMHPGVTWKR